MSCTALPVTVRAISFAKVLAMDDSWILGTPYRALEMVRGGQQSSGVVRCQHQLLNQHDEAVWSCVSTNLVEARNSEDPA